MKIFRLTLAMLAGFALGAIAAHVPVRAASSPQSGTVHLWVATLSVKAVSTSGLAPGFDVQGKNLVGLSCVHDATYAGGGVCYVATTQ